MAAISFHEMPHRFWAGWVTGTTALEAKIFQQLKAMREAVLCEAFLDLWKAYHALYRERALELTVAYEGRYQDGSTSSDVMGPTEHVSQGWRVLRMPIQGVPRCHAGRPPVPLVFQHGRGGRHPPLADGSDGIKGGHGGGLA